MKIQMDKMERWKSTKKYFLVLASTFDPFDTFKVKFDIW